MHKNTLAIIPARGGSKRIPHKNIKNFLGKPIIQYSIKAALDSGCFDEVMVSTDDPEIAEVAEKSGAKVPFFRSEKNSDDHAIIVDVLEEVLLDYQKEGTTFNYCCCLYPTAPFVTAERLSKSLRIIKEKNADSLLAVVKYSYPIQRALKIEEGLLKMIAPENANKMSRDFITTFHDAGQFCWLKTDTFLKIKKAFTDNTAAIEIPETEVQDIDTLEDWEVAEIKYQILHHHDNL